MFDVKLNAISQVIHEAASTDSLPPSAVPNQENPVINTDEMIIVTEKS